MISRRTVVAGLGALGAGVLSRRSVAAERPLPLTVAVRSPWMASQVALTSRNELFLGLPRYDQRVPTPSLARREADGSLAPFPGNGWNAWKPGDDGRDAFVYVNAVHIFADDTVWIVDWGAPGPNTAFPKALTVPGPGAQKLVRLDPRSGRILDVLRFDADVLPPGAQMNDLRVHGSTMYITESGLGAVIVHDMATGTTMRRLSGRRPMMAAKLATPMIIQRGSDRIALRPPNADLIEITADGAWLYWAAPTGPLYRCATHDLRDATLSDDALEAKVEHVADIAFSSGCAMDTRGNLYLSETKTGRVTLLSPSGRTAVLASDPTILRPDGAFIDRDRRLYVPIKQPVSSFGPTKPFVVYAIALPESFDGIALGGAVIG